MNFKDFLLKNEKEYKYTVKIACDGLDERALTMIKEGLKCLDLVVMTEPKSTPHQENPLDFPNVKNTSINIFDITVKYPSTTDMLERVVSESAGISRTFVIVYADKDPRKTYTEQYLERNSPEFKEEYKPKLGTMYEKGEKHELYGDEYNKKLVKELTKRRKDRKITTVTNNLIPKQVVDKSTHMGSDMGPIGIDSPISGKKDKK